MPLARFFLFRAFASVFAISALFSCASAPKPGQYTARELMGFACPADFAGVSNPKVVKGSVWSKIESKEMSGQFPASVRVEYPVRLGLEVTNLIGAPQAWLKMENGKTELRFTEENEREYGKPRVREMLGGLPLELAPRLFAGGVPCPEDRKDHSVRVSLGDEGSLEVVDLDLRTRGQVFIRYAFTQYAGKPWVNEVRWEKLAKDVKRGAKSNLVTILRESPSDPDGAPKRWSASSDRGSIQVRWKDRSVQ